jgi:hypothetical protein
MKSNGKVKNNVRPTGIEMHILVYAMYPLLHPYNINQCESKFN